MKRARIVILSPIRARLERVNNEKTLEKIDEELSFMDPGAEYKLRLARFRAWGYDGKKHLFQKETGTFPIGFVDPVRDILRKLKYKVKIVDQRKNLPKPRKPAKFYMTPWDNQTAAADEFVIRERGILRHPTASGKTITAALITARLGIPKTLFITHRRNLAKQTRAKFAKALGVRVKDIGFIGDGKWIEKQVTIAMLGSITKRFYMPAEIKRVRQGYAKGKTRIYPDPEKAAQMKHRMKRLRTLLASTGLLIVDECHHAAANTWKAICDRSGARWRLGLSGTPLDRNDGKSPLVIATCGPVIHRIRADELIAAGKIAKPVIRFIPVIKTNSKERENLYEDAIDPDADYHTVYNEGVVENEYRNRRAVRKAEKINKPVLMLVRYIKHGKILRRMAKKRGTIIRFAHGRLPAEKQERLLRRFKRGKIPILIATTELFGEGTDVPRIRSVVVCDGGKSPIQTLQRIGRAMRVAKGKTTAEVFDFFDYTHAYLENHSKARVKACEREGYDVKVLKVKE